MGTTCVNGLDGARKYGPPTYIDPEANIGLERAMSSPENRQEGQFNSPSYHYLSNVISRASGSTAWDTHTVVVVLELIPDPL